MAQSQSVAVGTILELWKGNGVQSPMLRHMCVLLAATALGGCGWFGKGEPSSVQSEPLRPGVDRQTTAAGLPPAPRRGAYDAVQSPTDDGRDQRLGTVVAPKGGQKAQIERTEKERSQREAERTSEQKVPPPPAPEPSPPDPSPTPDR